MIWDRFNSNPSGCNQKIYVSKHSVLITANAFRTYYGIFAHTASSDVEIAFSDSDSLANLGKIGGGGANKNKGVVMFKISLN